MFLMRFGVFLKDGRFYERHPRLTGWIHVVLNYIGPNNGQGIRIFIHVKRGNLKPSAIKKSKSLVLI